MPIPVHEIFTDDEPLGPFVTPDRLHEATNQKTFQSVYDKDNFLSRESVKNNPNVLLGRRGSGKTALLFHLRFYGGYAASTRLESEAVFNEVAAEISKIIQKSNSSEPLVETVGKIWRKVILTSCISQFHQGHKNDRAFKGSQEMRAIERFLGQCGLTGKRSSKIVLRSLLRLASARIGADMDFVGDFLEDMFETEIGFSDALENTCAILEDKSARAIILIDSLEQFPINRLDMCEALAGLLHFIGQFDLEYLPIQICICLPAELHEDFGNISDNTEKDFRKVLTLHWDPVELFQMCGHRFSIYLDLNRRSFPKGTRRLSDRPTRDEVWEFWSQFLPDTIENRYGIRENAVSYISRHTQLLPRHLLNILNKIAMLAIAGRHGTGRFSEDDIIKGVRLGEGVICEGVFSGFKQKYPMARDVCKLLLPKLPNQLDYSELRAVNRSYGKGLVKDTGELLEMLVRMGIAGRLVKQTETYDECRFDYTYNGTMPYSPDDRFGVHPAFSGQFGNNFDKSQPVLEKYRPIYPIEIFTGDRRGTGSLIH